MEAASESVTASNTATEPENNCESTTDTSPLIIKAPQEDRKDGGKEILRPSLYPAGHHIPTNRMAPLEEFARAHTDFELLTELKSNHFEGFYNLSFVVLSFSLVYMMVRNIREQGWLVQVPTCTVTITRDLLFATRLVLVLSVFSFLSFILIRSFNRIFVWPLVSIKQGQNPPKSKHAMGVVVVLVIHWASQLFLFTACAAHVMKSPINPLLGAGLGLFIVVVSLKMHSFVATNIQMAEETIEHCRAQQKLALIEQQNKSQEDNSSQYAINSTNTTTPTAKNTKSESLQSLPPKPESKQSLSLKDPRTPSFDGPLVNLNLLSYLKNRKKTAVKLYPRSVTFSSFCYFMFLAPTLVYEISYPRTNKIRIKYVLTNLSIAMVIMACQYMLAGQFVLPVLQKPDSRLDSMAFLVLKLAVPTFSIFFLFFFSFFHCFLNATAELFYFADRLFYLDWWNSTSVASFWRRWNMPVHEWCLRHVIVDSTTKLRVPKTVAAFTTFLLSALLHEYVFLVGFKVVRPYMFLGMIVQIPLIQMTELSFFKKTRRGNIVIWLSFFLGHPLIELMYFREYFKYNKNLICP